MPDRDKVALLALAHHAEAHAMAPAKMVRKSGKVVELPASRMRCELVTSLCVARSRQHDEIELEDPGHVGSGCVASMSDVPAHAQRAATQPRT